MNHPFKLIAAGMLLFGVLTPGALAIVPDPGNIYYGLAKDFMGQPLTPESNAEVVMMRVSNGTEIVISRSPILDIQTSGGAVNYVLRPPLDDGLAARYDAGAGRKDDVVGIYLIHNGIRYETKSQANCAIISDPVPILGDRGSTRKVDFRCIDDWDGDCIADSWERQYFGSTQFNGSDDWDDDDLNDLAEFTLGSDPFDVSEPGGTNLVVPNLIISTPQPGVARIDWNRLSGHNYTLEWSGGLDNFVPVPADKMIGSSGHEVNSTGMSKRFFRVRVTK